MNVLHNFFVRTRKSGHIFYKAISTRASARFMNRRRISIGNEGIREKRRLDVFPFSSELLRDIAHQVEENNLSVAAAIVGIFYKLGLSRGNGRVERRSGQKRMHKLGSRSVLGRI